MTQFAFEPIYGSIWVASAAAAAILAVIVLVSPPTANPVHRRWLILLRSIAAVTLLLAVFRPALVRTDNRPSDATLVVAVDTSRSMTLPDGEGSDRWTTQLQAWKQLATGLEGLRDSLNLELIQYDRDVQRIEEPQPSSLDDVSPDGDLTDLAEAAAATLQVAPEKPLAGVVLIGDGTVTASDAAGGAERTASVLNSIGVPLWSVPIGPAARASDSRDVAVASLPDHYQMFAGNEVNVQFELQLRGLAGQEVPVRLSWIDSAGQVEEAAIRRLVVESATETAAVSIPITAPAAGSYRLRAEADLQPGELISVNNSQTAFVDVREGGGRILYLEGTPRLEQTFLKRALAGFPDLDLTYQWIPTDTASRWPIDLADWFRPGEFDVYIIGDLDADALGQQQLAQLAETVAQGAGLVMLGGFQTYGSGGYATSPLAEVLPVRMNPEWRRDPSAPIDPESDAQLNRPIEVRLARSHPITDLGGDQPSAVWSQLPTLPGANRFLGPKIAPGIQVLLQTPDEHPLLVVGEYGRGRTAVLAIDSTYLWWRGGHREAHRRFWRQLLLWLLSREDDGGDEIQVELESRRFASDDAPPFRASVQSVDAATSVRLVAEIVHESGDVREVQTSTQNFEADAQAGIASQIPSLEPGLYRLRVRPRDESSKLKPAERAFQVIDESRELAQPMADPVYLTQLAELTADHGGRAFAADQVDQLLEAIASRRQQAETTIIEKNRLGDGPLSGWLLFAVFAAALSSEWWLRRKWGLA